MYHDMESFTNYSSYRAGIIIADGTTMWTRGRGTVRMEWLLADGSSHVVDIKNVLHVPALTCGLFSIHQVTSKGFNVFFSNDDCAITTKDNRAVGAALKQGNVYTLNVIYPTSYVAALIKQNMKALVTSLAYNDEAVELWHRRMGHLNEADLKRLMGMSKGISLSIKPRMKSICGACSIGKSRRKLSGKVQQKVS